ncbi:AAA family ATPase [Haloferax larsenii]|uniref:Tetratricopeptide repeat-containing protein n=1 Tax=Haloferax larsenii TaxID=302484 RepID=A0A1H7TWD3_HALLR|nr:hypothetical protein [Haloferax larsenii]SEL88736.1 hypothetical protein SAMN04488691_11073 [Haloferax larsenii]
MKKIEELEESRNPSSVESAVDHFELLHKKLDDPVEGQYQYEYYLPTSSIAEKILNYEKFDSELDSKTIRFGAFFAWIADKTQQTSLKTDDVSRFYERFKDEFEDCKMFDYLTARVYSLSYDQHELTHAMESGYKAAKKMTTNPNIQYTLCNSVLRYLLLFDYTDIYSETLPQEEDALLDECIWLLKQVIDGDRILSDQSRSPFKMPLYPQFLETLARLYLAREDFSEAHEAVKQAIEAANRSGMFERDQQRMIFSLSEIEYQISLLERYSEFDKRVSEAQAQMREFEKEIERTRTQTLQFIGFFAAVITAILAIVQVVVQPQPVSSSSRLIIVLISGLLVAFAGFSFMITERSNWGYLIRTIVVFLLGATGLWLGLFRL